MIHFEYGLGGLITINVSIAFRQDVSVYCSDTRMAKTFKGSQLSLL